MKKLTVLLIILILLISCSVGVIDNNRYLSDYDYLWEMLEDNYPYFGVLEREGIDWNAIKLDYREQIKDKSFSDEKFYGLLDEMMTQFNNTGHLSVVTTDFYHMARSVYTDAGIEEWLRILSQPNSELFYGYEETISTSYSSVSNNIQHSMNEEESVAYVNIKSFRYENIEIDQEILFEFYKAIEDFEHLIIDIRENRGGSTRYFTRNIIEPLTQEPLYYEGYMRYHITPYVIPFINEVISRCETLNDIELSQTSFEIVTPSELPVFESSKPEDLTPLDGAIKLTEVYWPNKDFSFDGQIWVLIGESVYSASEAFALSCKSTGFGTLVGQPTGGDGVGFDPIFISLPETGIIVRFSAQYGLNENGENNEEFGTMPDILIEYGESAYDRVLEIIRTE